MIRKYLKNHIQNPKPNGYKSLHILAEVPVFMTDHEESMCVEIQIRTIAMDFWASLEHKIFYKCNETVPSVRCQRGFSIADRQREIHNPGKFA
ncbi:hypothetical protein GRF59_26530 [Paenibacillus sp. HJL G12]|uniref:RelA/SpoT domain-containing protein n=1 Tax=Paenibacillus dendrobii TaxID=2691084 RepID=A0A7X3IPC5_9BACL|nr:hypothetical protein [Paenibacillus dendrobii]